MSASPRRAIARRLAAGSLAAATLLLGPAASAAWAHDALVSSRPAAGTTVATAPREVTLEFGEAPQALGTRVVVTGPDGAPAADGDPVVAGTAVTQWLDGGLPAGRYSVEWQATSADGHPVSGTFDFTATAPSGAAAAGTHSASADSGGSSAFLPWAGPGAIAAVAAGLLVRQRRRPA